METTSSKLLEISILILLNAFFFFFFSFSFSSSSLTPRYFLVQIKKKKKKKKKKKNKQCSCTYCLSHRASQPWLNGLKDRRNVLNIFPFVLYWPDYSNPNNNSNYYYWRKKTNDHCVFPNNIFMLFIDNIITT